jgi:hypothetical protein
MPAQKANCKSQHKKQKPKKARLRGQPSTRRQTTKKTYITL